MRQMKISNSITSRESVSLKKYMLEVSKIPLLNPEEEAQLCRRARNGEKKALDQLVRSNLRFVVSVAKQFQGQGLTLNDMVNEGNIGLIQAARKFDETRGFRFISFAVWCIRQSIMMAIARQAQLVRVPLHKTNLMKRIKKALARQEQELGRVPSTEELADDLGLPVDAIEEVVTIHHKPVSLDSPLGEEEDSACMLDTFANPAAEQADSELQHRQSLRTELQRQLSVLTDRQKETLYFYFGIGREHPLSIDEIARRYQLTTERVRQIKDKALEKLRSCESFSVLRNYL